MAADLDRILGAIFGCALGDALGLPAEGSTKEILAERYPQGLALPHATPTRGFPLNDVSDDTDQTVLMMRTLAAGYRDPTLNPATDFAARLRTWYDAGFPELGDTSGMGCGGMTWRVLRREDFLTDPFGAARAIIGPKAGNGALMRTAPCAFTGDPAGWASYLCRTTHSDPLCAASCVAQSLLVRELAAVPAGAPVEPECLRRALAPALAGLDERRRAEVMRWVRLSACLEDLDLGARDARGYALKSFGCSVWAYRQLLASPTRDAELFKRLTTRLVMEAGDADTNAAIAGAVLGAAVGYQNLPAEWLAALPHRDWLEAEVLDWAQTLGAADHSV